MSHQITDSAPQPTIGDQMAAFEALTGLAGMFGHLPIPYITVHSTPTVGFDLQLGSPQGFEAWRTALQIAPDAVELNASATRVWLAADGVFRGVRLHLSGFNVPLAPDVAVAEQIAVAA